MDKQTTRKYVAYLKGKHTETELARLSEPIVQQVVQHPRFIKANVVLLYHALPDEVQTQSLVEHWAQKKQIILPVVKGENLELRRYTTRQQTTRGVYGICEPTTNLFTAFEEIELAIIPGIAFDTKGRRLGRGKGYYDRLLAQLDSLHIYKIGLCFPFQYFNTIPAEPHDIAMNEVIRGE